MKGAVINKIRTRRNRISIPAGAIERELQRQSVSGCFAFQYQQVRLKAKDTSGELKIDPWAIKDNRLDPGTIDQDTHWDEIDTINANTPYPLTLDIHRGVGTTGFSNPQRIGHPTIVVKIPYQTWLIGVNTLGVKFRPSVKDSLGNRYSANAISGSINTGISVVYSFGLTTFTHRSTTSWSVTPALSLGMASASLSKEPFLKKTVNVSRNPSNFIFSPSFGIILARNDIGLFFAYGHDIMMGENADAWVYQYKRFLAFGLSASFKL